MLHIKFANVPPDKRGEMIELMKARKKRSQETDGVEFVGLFYPRGSGYMYAHVTRYTDYATWEKFWKSPKVTKERMRGRPISVNEMDMFFDEVELE